MADLFERDRERFGFTVGQIADRLGISPAEYRGLIAGAPIVSYATWERICEVYGWPQTFAVRASG